MVFHRAFKGGPTGKMIKMPSGRSEQVEMTEKQASGRRSGHKSIFQDFGSFGCHSFLHFGRMSWRLLSVELSDLPMRCGDPCGSYCTHCGTLLSESLRPLWVLYSFAPSEAGADKVY